MIIEVIPEAKSYKAQTFSYAVGENLQSKIALGSMVEIPFGRKNIRGLVVKISSNNHDEIPKDEYQIKSITATNPLLKFPIKYFDFFYWIAEYYFCTVGEAFSLFLPPVLKRLPKQKNDQTTNRHNYNLKSLSDAQNKIFQDIKNAKPKSKHLIYGVTGSGKTEIYLHLAAEVLKNGQSVVVLVPEIILAPQLIDKFQAVFGNQITQTHSHLSTGEKYKAYYDFYSGQKKIIIGPRSALLIPSNNLGLVIVDEEHEDAYKQDQSPRYHAVQVAEKLVELHKAKLVLGSATPRIETFYKASSGIYHLHQLNQRYNKLILPPTQIIDLKNEIRSQNYSLLSQALQDALRLILKNKKQAILFLNRRGSSTFVSCRDCGYVANCPNCEIPLVHYAVSNNHGRLFCHHCSYVLAPPEICPSCRGIKIKFFGAGVEKVENEVKKLFPNAKVSRIDAQTIKNKQDYYKFYDDFKHHRFDIAIGTQMIAKGFDIPAVDLVGIVSADTGLHLPYFRASEKIFRLITQVSGRSGRHHNVGKTIIQTYWPNSNAIQTASKHDYLAFYEHEIQSRKQHFYPPFSKLIRIISQHQKPEQALKNLAKILSKLDENSIYYLGPAPCFFQRLRGLWRYHLIIKLNNDDLEKDKNILKELWRQNLNLTWDIDPIDML